MNGNPFYVPPVIPDMGDTILGIGKLGMERERMLEESKYRQGMMANDTQRTQIEAAKVPSSQKAYTIVEDTRAKANLKRTTGLSKSIDNIFDNFTTPLALDKNKGRGELYDELSSLDVNAKTAILNDISREHESKLINDKNGYANSPQAKATESLMNALYNANGMADLTRGLLPDVARERDQMEANSKAVLSTPDKLYVSAKQKQYIAAGLDPDTATTKAVEDLYKQEAKKMAAGRTVIGVSGTPLPANIQPGVAGQRNEAALQGVSAGDAAIIKQLAEYKIPLPSGMALRTPYWQNILGRVAVYEPTFDATQYNVRMGVKRDFTSGNASKTALSLNTAIGHLESLAKAGDELNNSSLTPINSVINRIQPLYGDPRMKKLNTTINAVSGELATVFKNTSGTDQEIKSWKEQFSGYDSPQQIKEGGVNQAIELIGSRLAALRNKYEQGLGKPIDFQILSPKSRRILKGLGADVDALDPGGMTAAPAAAQPGETPQRRSTDKADNFRSKYNY
jgi:hypothetical protein